MGKAPPLMCIQNAQNATGNSKLPRSKPKDNGPLNPTHFSGHDCRCRGPELNCTTPPCPLGPAAPFSAARCPPYCALPTLQVVQCVCTWAVVVWWGPEGKYLGQSLEALLIFREVVKGPHSGLWASLLGGGGIGQFWGDRQFLKSVIEVERVLGQATCVTQLHSRRGR